MKTPVVSQPVVVFSKGVLFGIVCVLLFISVVVIVMFIRAGIQKLDAASQAIAKLQDDVENLRDEYNELSKEMHGVKMDLMHKKILQMSE